MLSLAVLIVVGRGIALIDCVCVQEFLGSMAESVNWKALLVCLSPARIAMHAISVLKGWKNLPNGCRVQVS